MNAERAYVGLGANLGDPRSTLEAALVSLAALPGCRFIARSSYYRTAPVDASGPDYLNAVAILETGLEPQALLAELQAIEAQHGRERPYVNAPRTLDLDLLLVGALELATPTLTLPHPRAHQRAFVLAPLAELVPELPVGRHGRCIDLLAQVADQPIQRLA